jgi:hypothetical protein
MNAGEIIRESVVGNFTILPNDFVQCKELTLEERGLLAFLYSKPDDFKIYTKFLPDLTGESISTIKRVWANLREKGYIVSTRIYENGGFVGWSHRISLRVIEVGEDLKVGNQTIRNQTVRKQTVRKPALINNTDINKTDINNTINKDEGFEEFWNKYDKKTDHKKALVKWRTLKEDDKKKILETIDAYVLAHPDKMYRKMPTTYLNGECWNDELEVRKPTILASEDNPFKVKIPEGW